MGLADPERCVIKCFALRGSGKSKRVLFLKFAAPERIGCQNTAALPQRLRRKLCRCLSQSAVLGQTESGMAKAMPLFKTDCSVLLAPPRRGRHKKRLCARHKNQITPLLPCRPVYNLHKTAGGSPPRNASLLPTSSRRKRPGGLQSTSGDGHPL